MHKFSNENKPVISVLIPVYNGAAYLEESIKSVINQTTEIEHEILIVDDQSTDNSVEIAKRYEEAHDHVRLIINEQNLGLVGNWNACIKQSKGAWLKFHFQDDILDKTCLQHVYAAAVNHQVNFVLSDRNYLFGENVPDKTKQVFHNLVRLSDLVGSSQLINSQSFVALLKNNYLEHNFLGEPICGFFNKKWLLETVGFFDPVMHQLVDYEFFIRVMSNTDTYFIDQPLVTFRVHDASQTSKNNKVSLLAKADRLYMNYLFITKEWYANLRTQVAKKQMTKFEKGLIKKVGFFSMNKTMKQKGYPYLPPFRLIYIYYELLKRLRYKMEKFKK